MKNCDFNIQYPVNALMPPHTTNSAFNTCRDAINRVCKIRINPRRKAVTDPCAETKGAERAIPCAKEDLFAAPKIKFSPRQKQALLGLPSKELFLILSLSSGASQNSLFDYIYTNNANLPYPKAELQNKSGEEILRLIEAHIPADNPWAETVRGKADIIASDEFAEECARLKNNIMPGGDDIRLYFEMFRIFWVNGSAFDRNIYIDALLSKEFKGFCRMIKTDYGANPFYDLIETLNTYLFPTYHNSLKQSRTREKIALLRAGLPDVEPSFFTANSSLKIINWLSREQIEEKIFCYAKLIKLYPYKINGKNDLGAFLSAENKKLKILAGPGIKENIWDYVNEYYPGKLKYNFLGEFLFNLGETADKFSCLDITAREADVLLKLFSTDIGKFKRLYDVRFKKITSADFKKLISEKKDFQNYLKNLYEKYPGLKNGGNNLTKIENITLAYINKGQFEALNSAAEKLNNGAKLPLPELNARNCGIKIKILDAVISKKLKKIIIAPNCEIFPDKTQIEHLNKILEKINNGGLEKLYAALTFVWGLKYIELDQIFDILANNRENLYLDKDNAAKFFALKDKYNILFDKKENKDKLENLNDLPRELLAQILAKENLLNADTVKDYVFAYFASQCQIYNGKPAINLKSLALLSLLELTAKPSTAEIIVTARGAYGFDNNDVRELIAFFSASNDYPGLADSIKTPETLRIFLKLKNMFAVSNALLLLGAVKTAASPGGIKLFEALKNMPGLELSDKYAFEYVLRFILSDENAVKNIPDPDFAAFYKKIIGFFYNNAQKINTVAALSRLYDEVKDDSAARELLFSDKYRETVSWLRTKYGITELHPYTLAPILKIAKNIEKIKAFIKKLNEKISANDLTLLAAVAEHPGYEEILFDRDKMLRELATCARTLPAKYRFKKPGQEQKCRLPLEQCSNLQLLRMILLKSALRDKDFMAQIGKITDADIKDASSEYGGIIIMGSNGAPKLKAIQSLSSKDNSYCNEEYPFLINGIMDFHCHPFSADAKIGNPRGPSGFIVTGGERFLQSFGDMACAEFYDSSGVVFSIISDPDKNNGKITVNACFYYADKTDPQNPREAVFNMGDYEVER